MPISTERALRISQDRKRRREERERKQAEAKKLRDENRAAREALAGPLTSIQVHRTLREVVRALATEERRSMNVILEQAILEYAKRYQLAADAALPSVDRLTAGDEPTMQQPDEPRQPIEAEAPQSAER